LTPIAELFSGGGGVDDEGRQPKHTHMKKFFTVKNIVTVVVAALAGAVLMFFIDPWNDLVGGIVDKIRGTK